jgi:hypothetical protein
MHKLADCEANVKNVVIPISSRATAITQPVMTRVHLYRGYGRASVHVVPVPADLVTKGVGTWFARAASGSNMLAAKLHRRRRLYLCMAIGQGRSI